MILPFWELTFRIKFWSTFHVFSGSVFGASFFIFFQDFMPKRMILGPLWKPAGAKMAPKIRQMASKWHPFLKGALACARSCSRLASNIGFGPLLVSILAIFSWFYINLNEIWGIELHSRDFRPLQALDLKILARFHHWFLEFSKSARKRSWAPLPWFGRNCGPIFG